MHTLSLSYGNYPERKPVNYPRFEFAHHVIKRLHAGVRSRNLAPYRAFARDVVRFADRIDIQNPSVFRAVLGQTREQLQQQGLQSMVARKAMALVLQAIDHQTGLKAYPTQIIAAAIMLDNGLAEMQTGEGKSLAILLAAGTAALSGIPVHVITANDYLAQRDAEAAEKISLLLELGTGSINPEMDRDQRRKAYSRDITFCTAKELVFDYLRDKSDKQSPVNHLQALAQSITQPGKTEPPVLRGLYFAIVDEADSILLDEAMTPFILSKQGKTRLNTEHYRFALTLAARLQKNTHYTILNHSRSLHLTEQGVQQVAQDSQNKGGLWQVHRFRTHLIEQALSALHLFQADRDYLIKDDEIQIIDAVTGRLAEGRKWSQGIHQLLELKENLELTDDLEQMAKITYQQFFPRFLKLGGTSATVHEDHVELNQTYSLPVIKVPLRLPCQRQILPTRLFCHSPQKWADIVQRTLAVQAGGQAILIAVESVEDSHQLSRQFEQYKIRHVVLNARQDAEEAEIIAQAGQPGSVTVATNMAGRGTDIKLSPQVLKAGGLHIICSHLNDSKRIDRQVQGRCARNGQPGTVETILSLEDRLFSRHIPNGMTALLNLVFRKQQPLPQGLGKLLTAWPQKIEKWRGQRQRKQLKRHNEHMRKLLAMGGARN